MIATLCAVLTALAFQHSSEKDTQATRRLGAGSIAVAGNVAVNGNGAPSRLDCGAESNRESVC